MSLKELARQYHYKEITGHADQLIINFLPENALENGNFAKALRSFDTYLNYFKKQDLLIEKGINPKKHKEYRLIKRAN